MWRTQSLFLLAQSDIPAPLCHFRLFLSSDRINFKSSYPSILCPHILWPLAKSVGTAGGHHSQRQNETIVHYWGSHQALLYQNSKQFSRQWPPPRGTGRATKHLGWHHRMPSKAIHLFLSAPDTELPPVVCVSGHCTRLSGGLLLLQLYNHHHCQIT